jgi:inositol-1,4,5-trisphosphate 5-phosphatase
MIPIWMREFLAVLTRLQPEFLAIHCQEVGGKNYEDTMQHVNKFIKLLLSSDEMQQFTRARVFLDEDFTAVEKFTALGSLYFIHHSVSSVEIFDFQDAKFVPVEGKEVLSGNIEHVRIKEKAKFAQEFFPDFVWSRKGFIRTRWNLCGTVFDLVNIHLIHDVSNVAAMETSPSTYCDFRVKALLHTIERFEADHYDKVPFFMFGDFNFRLDTHQFVKKLTQNTVEQHVLGKRNDVSKVIFKHQDSGKVILTVGKKDFHHHEHNELFSRTNAMTLQIYDKEPEACRSKLFEYKVTFPPSYPFSEDAEDGTSYMPTRCPGWCDRIMMSYDAPQLFNTENGFTSEYKMIGMHICMGDHKPIYLNLQLRHHTSPGPVRVSHMDNKLFHCLSSTATTTTNSSALIRHVHQNGAPPPPTNLFRETSV